MAQQLVDETIKGNTVLCSILACGKFQSNMMLCDQRALSLLRSMQHEAITASGPVASSATGKLHDTVACACPYGVLQHCIHFYKFPC